MLADRAHISPTPKHTARHIPTGYMSPRILQKTMICVSSRGSSSTSTYDSACSIATPPPDSDLDDEQIRALLAPPLYLQEREASADRSQVCHSVRENLVSSSSQVPKSTEKPFALFSSKRKSSQETFSDRED